jgi:hypothetical protein
VAFYMLHNILPLQVRRHRFNMVASPACPRCAAPVEHVLHFFTACPRVAAAWESLLFRAAVCLAPPPQMTGCCSSPGRVFRPPQRRTLWSWRWLSSVSWPGPPGRRWPLSLLRRFARRWRRRLPLGRSPPSSASEDVALLRFGAHVLGPGPPPQGICFI